MYRFLTSPWAYGILFLLHSLQQQEYLIQVLPLRHLLQQVLVSLEIVPFELWRGERSACRAGCQGEQNKRIRKTHSVGFIRSTGKG